MKVRQSGGRVVGGVEAVETTGGARSVGAASARQ